MRRRRVIGCVVAAVALVAATGCGDTGRKARADGPPRSRQAVRAPVVMFLGDSYTVGKLGQMPERTYAAETARALGWQVILSGFRGTGFVARGHIGKDFATLFDEQLSWRPAPDMVIIAGGHNDRIYRPAAVTEAARRLVSTVRLLWKGTKIVLIGPMWGGDPEPEVLATRDALATTATEDHLPFVDPLGEHWIVGDRLAGTGNTRQYILKDGTHPTTEGALYFAGRLISDLRELHLTEP
jgi:lysophospholipase L1-like esterase